MLCHSSIFIAQLQILKKQQIDNVRQGIVFDFIP